MKRHFVWCLSILVFLSLLCFCSSAFAETYDHSHTINALESLDLAILYEGQYDYNWSSSDPGIVSIDENDRYSRICTINGVSAGEAIVSCKSTFWYGWKINYFYITVVNVPVREIEVEPSKEVIVGDEFQIDLTLTPSNATTNVTWSSSNSKIAAVSGDIILALSEGTVVITATTANGLTDTCSVKVNKLPMTIIKNASSVDYNAIQLTWDDNPKASGYYLYRKLAGGKWGCLKTMMRGTTSYTDNTAICGKSYFYTIKAYTVVNGKNVYSDYDTKGISGMAVLNKPQLNTFVTNNMEGICISWKKVNGAFGYKVYRSTSKSGTYALVKTTTTTSWTDKDIVKGTTYYYKVRAQREESGSTIYGQYSSVSSIKAQPSKPNAKVSYISYDRVKISWSKVPGASGYQVFQSISSTGKYTKIATINSGTIINFMNTGLTTGSTYYYKVRAFLKVENGNVYGDYSSIVSAKPVLATPVVTIVLEGSRKIKVSWAKIAGANGYLIYRATSSTGAFTKVAGISGVATLSYMDTNLTTGKTYYYKVRAFRTVNGTNVYGSYSKIMSSEPK